MLDYAWIIAFLPAVSFLGILFLGKKMPRHGSELGIAAVGASFVLSCVAVVQWIDRVESASGAKGLKGLGRGFFAQAESHAAVVQPVVHSVTWWQNGNVKFSAGTQIDGLAVVLLFVVTLVSLLVHIYSTAYMHGDRRFTYFYAALSLFTASMLLLVISDNTLQLMVGWELVGLCSFMLIGHWWEEGANSDAALKAFFTTRTGDVGLMIGVIVTFFAAGQTFNIITINNSALAAKGGHEIWLAGAACLLIGIIGKSGQFPLHTWLPDAMAGPTPVSALIHAATMVVAGVYLGARVYGVFWQGFSISAGGVNAMALIGGVTIIIGALLAFVQDDIKKVLAYSTISQLGYMVMALGVGAWSAAVFHLFTHAFFKALLFLGAGSISHSGSHHSFDMKEDMGGLRKYMPITFWTFMIGTVALMGIPPFAGFFSKDEILATAGKSGFTTFMVIGLVGAFLTAAYMTRCLYYTFFGEYRGHGHPHESPRAITIPLIVLAAFSVLTGWLNATVIHVEKFQEWFEPRVAFPTTGVVHPAFEWGPTIIAVLVALSGIGVAYAYYWRGIGHGITERSAVARAGHTFLVRKYYLDVLYTDIIVGSIKGPIARAAYWVNQNVIDAAVNAVGKGARVAGRFTYDVIDQKVVDGAVNGVAEASGETGGLLRYVQSGRVQWYAIVLFLAVGLLSLVLVVFS
jgi:NADH-quinone oxidoreductase subunit L